MKKIFVLLLFAGLGSSLLLAHSSDSSMAFRVNGIYVDEDEEGLGGSIELGFILNGGHSVSQIIGAEIGYINFDTDEDGFDADADVIPLFMNLTLVGSCETGFVWELGAGIGGIIVEVDDNAGNLLSDDNDDDIVFGGQVFGRLGFEFTDEVSLLAGVRYMASNKADISQFEVRPLDSFAYDLSLQFKF